MTIASYFMSEFHFHGKIGVEGLIERAREIVIRSEIWLVGIAQERLHGVARVVRVSDRRRARTAGEVAVEADVAAAQIRKSGGLAPEAGLDEIRQRQHQANARRYVVADAQVPQELRRLAKRADAVELAGIRIGY